MGTKPAILIRRARLADIDAIASLLRDSFAEFRPLYTSAAFEATTPVAGQLRSRWQEGPVWVAVRANAILGTVAAAPRPSGLYIRSMAVHPLARGQGIARRLLEEIRRFAQQRHHERLFLSTTPFLDDAIRLYERFGFERTEDGPHDLFGTPLFTMVKALPTN
jgi:ribosomal protein S18 acetylase RimI-like enzyme